MSTELVSSRSQFGKLRANPDATTSNNFRTGHCDPCPPEAACEDTLQITALGSVAAVSFTVNGVVYTFPAGTTLADTAVIEATIAAALAAQGEYDIYVSAVYAGGKLTLSHIGNIALSAFIFNVSTPADIVRNCDVIPVCDYKLSVVDDPGDLSYDGGAGQTLAGAPYAFTGTPATDDATALTLAGDIDTAIAATAFAGTAGAATVEVDSVDGSFIITVNASFDFSKMTLGGRSFVASNCDELFA